MTTYLISIAALLVSVISVAAGIYFSSKGAKNTDVNEIKARAAKEARTDYMLDEISRNVTDIKFEMTNMHKHEQDITNRVVALESSYKSLHKRVDRFEKKSDLQREELEDE